MAPLNSGVRLLSNKKGNHMVRKLSLAVAFSLSLLASNSSIASVDFQSLSTVKEGTTTAQDIQKQYGAPDHEDHNPDGRYVYLYKVASPPPDIAGPTGEATASFLFGKDDKLIRMRFFKM